MHIDRRIFTMPPPVEAPDGQSPSGLVHDLNDFCDRLADASPGDVIPYHVGLLAADRAVTGLVLAETDRIALNALADRVLQLAEAGRVHLVQRRIGPERFAYLAIVRSWPSRFVREHGNRRSARQSQPTDANHDSLRNAA